MMNSRGLPKWKVIVMVVCAASTVCVACAIAALIFGVAVADKTSKSAMTSTAKAEAALAAAQKETARPTVTSTPTDTPPTPIYQPVPTTTIFERPALPPLESPFAVSGMLSYRKQILVPDNARVVVLWSVSAASPDYGYVFGEGTIDSENGSFEMEFDGPPPPEALNWVGSSALGVGVLLITTDQTLETGILSDEYTLETDILGASGQYGVIYVSGSFETWEGEGWFSEFDQGYSAGKGIDIPDSVFDGFEPIDPTTIEIIIDDFENIEFVNWT